MKFKVEYNYGFDAFLIAVEDGSKKINTGIEYVKDAEEMADAFQLALNALMRKLEESNPPKSPVENVLRMEPQARSACS